MNTAKLFSLLLLIPAVGFLILAFIEIVLNNQRNTQVLLVFASCIFASILFFFFSWYSTKKRG